MEIGESDQNDAFTRMHGSKGDKNPISLFEEWMDLARAHEINDPNAMAIATSDSANLPNVRMVLLKDFDAKGFVFYTNTESQKGQELGSNSQAAAVLHWKSLRRQVRFRGKVVPVSKQEADAYFGTRARASKIGAWASKQSQPMQNRYELEKAVLAQTVSFGVGKIPRPDHWSGFRIVPNQIEFWMDKPFRLHERVVFERDGERGAWTTKRLFP
tara:strand:+ start:5480 stop:6121 length:642 start_codon:yes stop_codon:yes gene_type:complete